MPFPELRGDAGSPEPDAGGAWEGDAARGPEPEPASGTDAGPDPAPECGAGTTRCYDDAAGGFRCVTTATDSHHCGGCNVECADGADCSAGTCACPAGSAECDGRCTDVQSDARNCGACGLRCLETEACHAGRCAPAVCPAGECDLLRDGCGGESACYSTSDGPRCYDEPDYSVSRSEGQSCRYINDCRAGLSCMWGACRKPCCEGSSASCYSDRFCLMAGDGFGACVPDVDCDPVDQNGCAWGSDEECHVAAGIRLCLPAEGASRPEGATCTYVNDCAGGYTCDEGTCRRFCDTSDPHCAPGYTCVAVETVGRLDLGICLPD